MELEPNEVPIDLLSEMIGFVGEENDLKEQLVRAYSVINQQQNFIDELQYVAAGYGMMAMYAFCEGLRSTDEFWNGANKDTYGREIEDPMDIKEFFDGNFIRIERKRPKEMFDAWRKEFEKRLFSAGKENVEEV